MLAVGVLKLLIGISVLSQYKLWTLAHGQNSSTAWFITYAPPENGDQDTLEAWLYGPLKTPPILGQDCPLKWLYGPFFTQRPAYKLPEAKEEVKTAVCAPVMEVAHKRDPEIEVNDPQDKWLQGPEPDYLVNSGSEGNVYMDHSIPTE
ncbi:hypothetical protein TOT_030000748 [Theileria orientalis strain Shintoku]|uniref:Uncharacterized protein n=1 Tax=Theileria orientalis strain Shintoku TaxID=869250 RepID=J4C433_THEOR|nr:hypothetical protein TOT_030000748 [Theileria orientalis strain Shintoku]PVC53770.1 hypothetical protein MACL_00003470 [Theileria orientalis]BAM41486.1 hypothetical protein TOT_030000748 [Theileria orientalis strain Shintoku]|eukprot:XP_009691787.1 hypothetical protein TOT_030000748 [Theileria orientalis strain Shintoku]